MDESVPVRIPELLTGQEGSVVRRALQIISHVLVTDERCRVREGFATARVIIMGVTVNDVPHREPEAFIQLLSQPWCNPGVGGVYEDDSFGCDEKHSKVAVVSESVQVTREIRDLELRQTFPRPETHSLGMGELHHGAAHTDGYDQGYCLFQHGITRLFFCLDTRSMLGHLGS